MSQRCVAAVGIDVAEERKGLDLVALASDRAIVESRGHLKVDEVVDIVMSLRPEVVCINSPSGWSLSGKSRLAERRLAAIGIQSYRTGPDPGGHPFYRWIRVGMQIYASLAAAYPLYRGDDVLRTTAEVFPHATAALLAGHLPSTQTSKSVFRRGVLRESSIQEGALPTPDRVDAALGALTGLVALQHGHSVVGDPHEGVILLPVSQIPSQPLSTGTSTPADLGGPAPPSMTRSPGRKGVTVQIGYTNRNQQTVVAATGLPGTDHGQSIYMLRCGRCGLEYGSNGSDNFQRTCPRCQRGATGLPTG